MTGFQYRYALLAICQQDGRFGAKLDLVRRHRSAGEVRAADGCGHGRGACRWIIRGSSDVDRRGC